MTKGVAVFLVVGVLVLSGCASLAAEAASLDFAGWTEVPGDRVTDAALAAVEFSGHLYVFAKGALDPWIYVNSTRDGVTWTGWSEVPGNGLTDAALACCFVLGTPVPLCEGHPGYEDLCELHA